MKTQCPFCHEAYDVEDEYLGFEVECSNCGRTFVARQEETPLPPGGGAASVSPNFPSSPLAGGVVPGASAAPVGAAGGPLPAAPGKTGVRSRKLHLVKGGVIALILVLACLCYYFFVPNVWRAKRNFTAALVQLFESRYDVVDSSALRKLCKVEAEVSYAKAKQAHAEDFWIDCCCDGSVSDLVDYACERFRMKAEWDLQRTTERYGEHSNYKDAEEAYEKSIKDLDRENRDVFRKIEVFSRGIKIQKNCFPELEELEKIATRNYYCRSRFLAYLEDTCEMKDKELREKGQNELTTLLLTSYSSKVQFVDPSALKTLCNNTAAEMLKKLEEKWGEDVLFDFVRLIRSDVVQKKINDDGTTMRLLENTLSAFMPNLTSWLDLQVGKYTDFHKAYQKHVRDMEGMARPARARAKSALD